RLPAHALRVFDRKVHAGAQLAFTHPVLHPGELEAALARAAAHRTPVVAGIWPLLSLRNAEFLANEVPGVHVPQSIVERMREAQAVGDDAALAEGMRIAREVVERVKGLVQGIQVSAPFGRVDAALQVLG